MKTRYSLVALAIGLGLALALLWVVGGQTVSAVTASNAAGAHVADVQAAELHVCLSGCPYSSVQAAVDAADHGDTIKVAAGTYVGTLHVDKAVILEGGYSGPPDWTRDLALYETVLDGSGQGGETVVRFVGGSQSSVLDGFTVTGGDGQGGIRIDHTEVQVAWCTVTGNRSDTHWGGGINVDNGSQVTILHTMVQDNVAQSAGGLAALRNSTVWLVDSEVAGNSTTGGAGGGIGLWWGASLTATDSLVHHNSTPSNGGGIEISDSASATFERTDFVQNTANRAGGAIRVKESDLQFSGGLVQGNTASTGGGIAAEYDSTVSLVDSEIVGNQALQRSGGGIVADGGSVDISDTKILDNTAQTWGGGAALSGACLVTMQQVEVRGNHAFDAEGGGLVFIGGGTLAQLSDVIVVENQADGGGGISMTGEGPVLHLERVVIARNLARWAGGLRPYQATVVGDRVWIVDNVATEEHGGGGFVASSSEVNLTNALIAGNVGHAGSAHNSSLTLTNITVANNTRSNNRAGIDVRDDSTATLHNSILFFNGDVDLECDGSSTCTVDYSNLEYPWPGTGNISSDPLFVDAPNGDFHLRPDSPCVDVGDNDAPYLPLYDIDGDDRILDGNGDGMAVVDMGVDEFRWRYIYLPLVQHHSAPPAERHIYLPLLLRQ